MRTSKREIPEWLERTHSPDARERRRALQALCPCELKSHSTAVWQRMLEMGDDPDPSVRRGIIHVLCDGSPAAYEADIVRVLQGRYNDPDRSVRRMARHVLAKYQRTGNLNTL
jgi:hypothetical protein